MCLWVLFLLFGSILVFGGRTVASLLHRGTELARGADSRGLASLTPASCFLAGGRPGLAVGSQGLVGGGGAKIGSVQCSLAQDWSKFFALGCDWWVQCFLASGWSVGFSFLLGSLLVGGGWSAEFWLVSFLVSGGPALRGGP